MVGIAIATINQKLSTDAEGDRVSIHQHQGDGNTEIDIIQQGPAHKIEASSHISRQEIQTNQTTDQRDIETTFHRLAYAHSSIQPLKHLPAIGANRSSDVLPMPSPPEPPTSTSPGPERFSVSGKVSIFGDLPSEKRLPLDPRCTTSYERNYPGTAPSTRFFITEDGGLGDVLVTIIGIESNSSGPQQPIHRITAKGCWFSPYISACQTGQIIQFNNEDDSLHSIMNTPTSSGNSPFTVALLPGTKPFSTTYDEPEEFLRFKCDTHPWMFAYLSIVDHSYFAITAPNGDYSIPDLPAGNYQIKARHRKAGDIVQDLVVTDSDTALDFEFTYSTEN